MQDVQNKPALEPIPIDLVGVSELRYPIVVLDRQRKKQHTVAKLSASADLPKHFRGTHMSRFIEVLSEHQGEMSVVSMLSMLTTLKRRLNAKSVRIEVSFPYFLERVAPKSKAKSLMDYDCNFTAEMHGRKLDFIFGVKAPVMSLCPCSKAISDFGAHNQRAFIHIEVRSRPNDKGGFELVWLEELIEIAESSASSPVYALLKRPDERHLTMQSYENPTFVEDMARNAAAKLMQDERITWFRVRAESQESIHNHNAFARIEWPKKRK